MDHTRSLTQKRAAYKVVIPTLLTQLKKISFCAQAPKEIGHREEIQRHFPHFFNKPVMIPKLIKERTTEPLRVGVIFSGGQAAGGHNVITGLFDTLKQLHKESHLLGFLHGPEGIIEGNYLNLTEEILSSYRNQGGFDLIGSGRTKIETQKQFSRALATTQSLQLDGVVIIGGDDSNTNAALLAEYFMKHNSPTSVIGVPKTIDGDLQNKHVAISFGFDTACRVYSEMIGNIARDALSAKKYTHFIKLMGRSASHIALECALQTHPNYTIIGEEVSFQKKTLQEIAKDIAKMITQRSSQGKNYGVILIPEGLIEFIPEMNVLIQELNTILAKREGSVSQLSKTAKKTFDYLPKQIQEQLLLDRDPHGNMQVSHIQTEQLISHVVSNELKKMHFSGHFNPIHHFFGYEGRAGFPSNFDATYCYSLGITAALLTQEKLSAYMSCITNLTKHPAEWSMCAIPLPSLMHMEMRKGKEKIVIEKALVNLDGRAFKAFEKKPRKMEIPRSLLLSWTHSV